MAKSLVIVESPAKAKTIQKYLGNDYDVLASYGHVRDLPPHQGSVDTEHQFKMTYIPLEKNARHIDTIAKAVKKVDTLLLATDPDREGEAISWHVYELLNDKKLLEGKEVKRIVFNEVTKAAVHEAINRSRAISMDLVNSQQARRALPLAQPPITPHTRSQHSSSFPTPSRMVRSSGQHMGRLRQPKQQSTQPSSTDFA